MAKLGGLRITSSVLIALVAGAVIVTAAVIDVVRPATSDPFEGDWYYSDGGAVPDHDPFVLNVYRGNEDHCGWAAATFLEMAWPPGRRMSLPIPAAGPDVPQYIRDPRGVVDPDLAANFDPSAELPPDARPTGFQRGPWRIFVSETKADRFIYLASDGAIEAWPSSSFATNWTGGTQDHILCI